MDAIFASAADTVPRDLNAPRDDIYTLSSAIAACSFLQKAGVWIEVRDHDLKIISAKCPPLIWLMSARGFSYLVLITSRVYIFDTLPLNGSQSGFFHPFV